MTIPSTPPPPKKNSMLNANNLGTDQHNNLMVNIYSEQPRHSVLNTINEKHEIEKGGGYINKPSKIMKRYESTSYRKEATLSV